VPAQNPAKSPPTQLHEISPRSYEHEQPVAVHVDTQRFPASSHFETEQLVSVDVPPHTLLCPVGAGVEQTPDEPPPPELKGPPPAPPTSLVFVPSRTAVPPQAQSSSRAPRIVDAGAARAPIGARPGWNLERRPSLLICRMPSRPKSAPGGLLGGAGSRLCSMRFDSSTSSAF